MRKCVRYLKAVFLILCFLGAIYFNDAVKEGIKEGLHLCVEGVIPSLFPFLVLSSLLLQICSDGNSVFLTKTGRILGLPKGAEGAYIIGLLGGYPTGAKMVGDLSSANALSKIDAERMLMFCSNCGPAFILGMAFPLFNDYRFVFFLWIQHILSSFMLGAFLPKNRNVICRMKANQKSNVMEKAIQSIGIICGWVVLFRAIIYLIKQAGIMSEGNNLFLLFGGMMELTNGILLLKGLESVHDKLLLACIFINFGGICVLMQTISVAGQLKILPYIFGKIAQTGIGMILTELFYISVFHSKADGFILPISCGIGLALIGFFISRKIVLEIQKPIMYNREQWKEEYHAVS